MFNIGAGELTVILIVALLVLGPKRLPELARGLGKFMREFRRQTDEVRTVVEREFYRMDQDAEALPAPPQGTAPARKPGPPDAGYRAPSPAPAAAAQPDANAEPPDPAEPPKLAEGGSPAPEAVTPPGDPPKAG